MAEYVTIEESPLSRFLFSNTKMAWLWLVVRMYVGAEWLSAGWEKIHNPIWSGSHAGGALTGFLNGALAKTSGPHPDVSAWYASFLKSVVLTHPALWSNLVAWGEVVVGLALIVGFLTGIAAFFGLFMNLNYLLAGTVSTNPILFTLSIALILAWKIAGYYGLDRYLLPKLGTPWKPGSLFRS